MKRKLLFVATILFASVACAQHKAGSFTITPKVGVGMSTFSGKMPARLFFIYSGYVNIDNNTLINVNDDDLLFHLVSVSYDEKKNKLGLTIGVEAEYYFSKVVGLSLGAFYTQEGTKYKTKGNHYDFPDNCTVDIKDDLSINLDCITMPLLVNAYVWKGLSLEAGLQPEFAIGRKVDCDIRMNYKNEEINSHGNDADLRKFSLSLPIGASYEYHGFEVNMRYVFGLTNLNKGDGDAARNRTWLLTLGYKL